MIAFAKSVFLDDRGTISAADVSVFLLEESRVCRPGPGERNFHVFHELCTLDASREPIAADQKDPSEYPLQFRYLRPANFFGARTASLSRRRG